MDYIICDGELYHHGIKGQKWGRRRYQNPDGSLTPAGVKRYSAATRAARGHGGPGVYVGNSRKLAGYKRDLEFLDKGGHLSYGVTKKRQELLDKRDRENLKKKIAEAEGKANRAAAKKQAKEEYSTAKKSANTEYRKATKNADDEYEKDMASKNLELAKVKKTYDVKDEEIKRYYDSEISKHKEAADAAKSELEFWDNPDSYFYKKAEAKYNESMKAVKDAETRRDAQLLANKYARDNANISVNEKFHDNSETAEAKKNAAYVQAGKDYVESVRSAKQTYKESKKRNR